MSRASKSVVRARRWPNENGTTIEPTREGATWFADRSDPLVPGYVPSTITRDERSRTPLGIVFVVRTESVRS